MRLTPDEIEHIQRTGTCEGGMRTIRMDYFKALIDTAMEAVAPLRPPAALTELYAGATVEIPGGSIELGLQRGRGEQIALKRSEAKRICAEEALVLNGDDVTEDSAARLTDRLAERFAATWPRRAWFLEVWCASERLTQVYHRWPWPGDNVLDNHQQ